MQFVRGSALLILGLLSAVSFAGLTPSYSIDTSATNGNFVSSLPGDSGAGSFDGLVNSDPASFNAFSGAVDNQASTFTNGTAAFYEGGFSLNAQYSFDGDSEGYSSYLVRGGVIANEVADFAVNYSDISGMGTSRFFINGIEIINPEGNTYTGRLNVGDKLELLLEGKVTGPGNLSGGRGLYAEICPPVAVPEPATLAALGGGVALLARRRRMRKS